MTVGRLRFHPDEQSHVPGVKKTKRTPQTPRKQTSKRVSSSIQGQGVLKLRSLITVPSKRYLDSSKTSVQLQGGLTPAAEQRETKQKCAKRQRVARRFCVYSRHPTPVRAKIQNAGISPKKGSRFFTPFIVNIKSVVLSTSLLIGSGCPVLLQGTMSAKQLSQKRGRQQRCVGSNTMTTPGRNTGASAMHAVRVRSA